MSTTGIILIAVTYSVYLAFWIRIMWHFIIWYRASNVFKTYPSPSKASLNVVAIIAADLFLFRRLFISNKLLWLGSWTFHLAFILVLFQHLRFFMDPVPSIIFVMQPVGRVAGYALPVSIVYMFGLKMIRERYMSRFNIFIMSLIFFISTSGLALRFVARPDLVQVKAFMIGILRFSPESVPDSYLFLSHFLMGLLLLPYLPSHVFTAPFVTIEATKRDEGLNVLLHD
jgi:nitrate reductase gamma subunit